MMRAVGDTLLKRDEGYGGGKSNVLWGQKRVLTPPRRGDTESYGFMR